MIGNPYTPGAWYWLIGSTTTTVWSSAALAFVPIADADYVAFLTTNLPSWQDSAQAVADVMLAHVLPLLLSPGLVVTSTATSALNGTYAIDSASQTTIASLSTGIAAGKPLPGGGTTFNYADISGVRHAFSGPNFLNFATAVSNHVYLLSEAIIDRVHGTATALPSNSITIV